MRSKIIAVFTVVVLVVAGLSYAVTRATLGGLAAEGEAPRALAAAGDKLRLDGLLLERWIGAQADDAKLRDPFNAGTAPARADAATNACNALQKAAATSPELVGISPSLVVLVDANGVVLGRNGSALMRGDDLGSVYPAIKQAIGKGATGSDVWVSRARNEQMLASFAPIRGADGEVIGGVAIGTAINDERLTSASERTSGHLLLVAIPNGGSLDIVAKSQRATPELVAALGSSPAKDGALRALASGQVVDLAGLPKDFAAASRPLDGYGDGRRAVLIGATKLSAPAILGSLLWPALGVAALGILLVVAGGFLLDAYMSRPISEIEEGLLAIMNGRTDLRFEIEHAELGGLVFRLNSLLNQLLGVQEEEDTDEQGRPSRAPMAESFQDALAVDERMVDGASDSDPETRKLREEADDAYYERIFTQYIAAKTELGDPVDHITKQAFIGRIMGSEREMADKHGKPVRYKVEVRGREVVLLAVPLA